MAPSKETVEDYLQRLEHPMKAGIEQLRARILQSNAGITEQVKWNAPSFCYQGDDRVTFRLHSGNRCQLIFHRGAKAKEDPDFSFEDPTGLMQWLAKDRAVVTFSDQTAIEAHAAAVIDLINRWIKATS